PARGHAVDRDVVRLELLGQAASVFVDGRLGDGINRTARAAHAAGDAADGDDPAALARHHFGRHLAAAKHGGKQIAVKYAAQIVERDAQAIVLLRTAAAALAGPPGADVAAGAADEQIDAPPAPADFAGDTADFGFVADISPHRHRLA